MRHSSQIHYVIFTILQAQAAVKLHGVFSPRWKLMDCSSPYVASPGCRWDSGALVVPFMRVGTYPTRHLATLRESELLPALTGPLARLNPSFRYPHRPGFSDYTNPFGLAVACVFIKQSKPPCHCNLLTPFLMKCAGIPYT